MRHSWYVESQSESPGVGGWEIKLPYTFKSCALLDPFVNCHCVHHETLTLKALTRDKQGRTQKCAREQGTACRRHQQHYKVSGDKVTQRAKSFVTHRLSQAIPQRQNSGDSIHPPAFPVHCCCDAHNHLLFGPGIFMCHNANQNSASSMRYS